MAMDKADDRPIASHQEKDPDSLMNFVRRLTRLRHAHKALQASAAIEFIYAKKKACPLVYERSCDNEKIMIIINPSEKKVSCPVKLPAKHETLFAVGGKIKRLATGFTADGQTAAVIKI